MALQIGVSVGDFWQYTIGEIWLIIDSYNERRKREQREQLELIYELADLIGNRFARAWNGDKVKLITLEEVHPELFEATEEEKMLEIAKKQNESRRAFAERYNPVLRAKYGRREDKSINTDDVRGEGLEESRNRNESDSQ